MSLSDARIPLSLQAWGFGRCHFRRQRSAETAIILDQINTHMEAVAKSSLATAKLLAMLVKAGDSDSAE